MNYGCAIRAVCASASIQSRSGNPVPNFHIAGSAARGRAPSSLEGERFPHRSVSNLDSRPLGRVCAAEALLVPGTLDDLVEKSFRVRFDHPHHRFVISAQPVGNLPPRPLSQAFVG